MKTDTYRGATFISTDAHVTEPIELYTERLDAELRPRAPRIDTRDGWRVLIVEGLSSRKLMTASQLEVAVVGDWDVEKRVKDQEHDGVSAEVVFPTFALQACFASDDPALQLALCRAYNGWAAEAMGGHHRILPVGLVPAIDIDDAIREVELVAEAGFRALFLPARVPSRPYNDAVVRPAVGRHIRDGTSRHVPLRYRLRTPGGARSGWSGDQLHPGGAARRADGAAEPGRRGSDGPLSRAPGRHGGNWCVVVGLDHDASRSDL